MTECVAIFGGSFNPPHTAHVMLVRAALEHTDGAARVLIVPTFTHAFGKQLAPYEDRVEMCRLAFAPPLLPAELVGRVEISEIERELGGVSYTVETVRELRRRMPDVELRLLMGSDLAAECATWREADELFRLARPMFVPRQVAQVNHPVRFASTPPQEGNNTRAPKFPSVGGVPVGRGGATLCEPQDGNCEDWLNGVQLPAVSSTDVRELLRNPAPENLRKLAQLVPAPAVEYALAQKIYRD